MPEATPSPARPWRVIAEEVSREYDSRKLAQLILELNQALAEQGVLRPEGMAKANVSAETANAENTGTQDPIRASSKGGEKWGTQKKLA